MKLMQKPVMVVGKGFFSSLKKAAAGALKVGNALGIKPSDIISSLTKDKGGLTGVLGQFGADLARQKGFGMMKKGMKVHEPGCKMSGKGFFSDLFGAITSIPKALASTVAEVAMPLLPLAGTAAGLLGAARGRGMCGCGPSSVRGIKGGNMHYGGKMHGGLGVGFSNSYSLRSAPTLKLV
jgi:hypothetical protein